MSVVGENELAGFRSLIARHLGLWFDDHRKTFLVELLGDRVAASSRDSVAGYLQALGAGDMPGEWQALARPLTVPETYFLRGGEHFRALTETVLPNLLRNRPGQAPLRLLSAGCASGEEVYSLAIALREFAEPLLQGRRVEIVGVDINRDVLAKARAGRYSAWSLRETPPEIQRKYFRLERAEFVLDETIRRTAVFEERNLAQPNDDLWQAGAFDVVFCRNLLMYFVPEVAEAVVDRIRRSLASDGFLFLGHAETLRGLSQAFHLRHSHGAFYYQTRHGSAEEAPARSAWREGAARDEMAAAPATPTIQGGVAWFEEIGRASSRIAEIASGLRRPAAKPAAVETPPAPGRLNRILDLHRQERFSDALAQLQGLPAGVAADADMQVLQAVLLVNCGRLSDAEALCRPLLGLDDTNAGAHYVAALCREHAGDFTAAEEHDAAAAYLDPSFAMPRFHLGLLCKRLGRAAEAVGHFEAAIALLLKEDPVRLLLFGGGFSRETLVQASRGELLGLRNGTTP